MISWFAKNDVAANLLMISVVMLGLYSIGNTIPLEIFPTVEPNRISVTVSLRGGTPEDIETSITSRIEESINDLEGIEEYTSRTTEGRAQVLLEVEEGYNTRDILDDVKNRVDAINTFPNEAERPIIALEVRKRDVITVTIAGNVSEREIKELAQQIRDDILRVEGITQIELSGVRDYEIAIEVNQDTLREYDLTLTDISDAIAKSSLDLSGGNIRSEAGDILIRSKGQAYRQDEFESIVLKSNADGTVLTLGDIALVNDGFEESAVRTRFNGQLAATLQVYRVGEQSAIEVAQKVKQYIAEKQITLPQGIELTYWDDDSEFVKSRINTLTTNAIQGGILVFILLSLFLRPAVAFWVFIGIPVSFLGAFFVMPYLGITLNLISLFAFILVLGIVVDDAIVTGENVYTHLQRSENGLAAAINGTREIAVPVTFGVLTTVAAFIPFAFVEGRRGPIFAQIPAVVIPCLMFSLLESKLVLPSHLKHIQIKKNDVSTGNRMQRFQRNFSEAFEQIIFKYYRPGLKLCLHYRYSTVIFFAGALGVIIISAVAGHTRFTFFPRVPSETIRMNLVMPTGTPFEVTDKHIQQMTQAAQFLKEKYRDEKTGESVILNILSSSGGRGGATNQGRVRFEIAPPESRKSGITSHQLSREWRQVVGNIPGAEEISLRAEHGRSRDPIDIQLRASEFEVLEEIAEKIRQRLATYPTVFGITDSLAEGKEELQVELKPEAYLLGLSRSDIIRQIRQAFFGLEVQRVQRGRDDLRIMVRFPREERSSVAYLNSMLIQAANGHQVPLVQLVNLSPGQAPATIYRINGYRTLSVRADVEKQAVNMTALQSDLSQFVAGLVAKYPGVTYKFAGESEEQQKSLTSLAWGVLAVFFVIYCLLAIPFKSYFQPLVVMSVIPFGAIGAMVGHWIMGMNLTIMSLLGVVALTGVVVNDSLLLVDYINKSRLGGHALKDAILSAGVARFRPVMLTSLTTFIGLLPLLFEKATQAQFLIPMAVSLGFGIIFATLITLIFVPINYLLMQDAKGFIRRTKSVVLKVNSDQRV